MLFDFHKAFDSVPHEPLMDKLCLLGLNPSIVTWVHNYLADRKQRVVVNEESMEALRVMSGVLQESILGPLLFLIDIAHASLSEGSRIILYAHDILLYHPITSTQALLTYIQRDVDAIALCTPVHQSTT